MVFVHAKHRDLQTKAEQKYCSYLCTRTLAPQRRKIVLQLSNDALDFVYSSVLKAADFFLGTSLMNLVDFTDALPTGVSFTLNDVSFSDTTANVTLTTTEALQDGAGRGRLTITCSNVAAFQINHSVDNALIDSLTCAKDDPLLWDYGQTESIFGKAPLPDPPRFFAQFAALLESKLGIERSPTKYLNWQGSYNDWRVMVTNRAYNLLTAPTPLIKSISGLLEMQALEFQVLADPPPPDCGELVCCRFDTSWIVCASADVDTAILD